LIVFIINLPGKEGATKEKVEPEIVLSLLSAMLDRLRTSRALQISVVIRKNKVNRAQMHPSGTGSTTRMAKPAAPDQVVQLAILITAPLMRFLYG
jgi:hypothetical protein